jgi:HK97 family phage portal protein
VFGVPPIVTAAEQLGLVLASRKFQSIIWAKGAIPVGVLTTPKTLKQGVVERLRSQWEEFYKGEVTGRVAILEDDLTFQPVKPGLSPADTNLTEYNRFGVEEVARLYGVPPSVLGQTHSASYSTAVEEYRAAVLHCLRPWAARFTDCLGRALLTREQRQKGLRIEAPLDHLLVAPGKETSEYLKELMNSGALSTNEARNILGYPDIPGGELHRVPVNMTALDNLPKIGLTQPKQETP